MSYYVNIEIELDILNVKELAKAIEPLNQDEYWNNIRLQPADYKNGTIHFLELDDYYKNYDEEEFDKLVDTIKPYVKGWIYVTGEETETWAVEFDGKGNAEHKDGTTFYGFCSYDKFMEEYEKDLPENIVKDLKDWWIAKQV